MSQHIYITQHMYGDYKVKEGVIEEKVCQRSERLVRVGGGGIMGDLNGVSELILYKVNKFMIIYRYFHKILYPWY